MVCRVSAQALVALVATTVLFAPYSSGTAAQQASPPVAESAELRAARHHYFSARYTIAADAAAPLTQSGPETLAAFELRTAALHFELKRHLDDAPNKGKALKQCAPCQGLLDAFMKDVAAGRALAKAALKTQPQNESALFYSGKIDSNYVWLQLSTLGKRTGWSEYWNARRSMDAVLKINPKHVRARVARAWIDYIVDTRVPFGTQWILGGGDRKRALRWITEATADSQNGYMYDRIEAEFALWEMLVREKRPADALAIAKKLVLEFPDNQDLQKFTAGK